MVSALWAMTMAEMRLDEPASAAMSGPAAKPKSCAGIAAMCSLWRSGTGACIMVHGPLRMVPPLHLSALSPYL